MQKCQQGLVEDGEEDRHEDEEEDEEENTTRTS
jgi:hypothetical protein